MATLAVFRGATLKELALADDPYANYRSIARSGDVVYLEADDAWLVLSHGLTRQVLRDPVVFGSHRGVLFDRDDDYGQGEPPLFAMFPPQHTKIRQGIAPAFAPRFAARIAEDFAGQARTAFDRTGVVDADLLAELIIPYIDQCLCGLLGLTADERAMTAALLAELSQGRDHDDGDDEAGGGITDAQIGVGAALRRIAETRDEDDPEAPLFLRTLRRGNGEQAPLLTAEIRGIVSLVLFAGYEDLVRMAANLIVLAIAHHGDPRHGPEVDVDAFITEAIRLAPSTHFLRRTTTVATVLGGIAIPADAKVVVAIALANRDERVFSRPDAFLLDRPNPGDALTFGTGPHVCVGRHIAQAILRAFLEEWLARHGGRPLAVAGTRAICQNNVVGYSALRLASTAGGSLGWE